MDRRLIVTMAFTGYLVGGALFAIAQSAAGVTYTESQVEFIVLVGYLGPLLAMGFVWVKNYGYGAPLLVGTTATTCWFVVYFFFVHDNPANVGAVTGDSAGAYTASVVAVVALSLVTALTGTWLWYCESDGFREAVDDVIRPTDARE
ncbi:hypothetical protein [Natronosalvus caseinilyticus]|uniref:hypothetical protein n=1 Tax=Natronosalvus caseinilyticus TaxID=2953747 RepID=UPI0028A9E0A8|nr:hypothetical protein [Natronosalvus caseinilyticus]